MPCLPLEYTPSPRKAIGRSRSFGRTVKDAKALREALAMHTVSAARALRQQESVAGAMHITIETNPFVKPYYGKTILARFETPTASTSDMIRCAREGLKRIYKSGESYNRAGILLTDLHPQNAVQTSLFWDPNTKRNKALLKVVDHLMARWGRHKIRWAAEGLKRD